MSESPLRPDLMLSRVAQAYFKLPTRKGPPWIMAEKTGQEIISKIVSLSQKSRVCIQWIPSHVGVFGNEVADLLAKEGSALPSAAAGELFAFEIFFIHRAKANSTIGKSLPHTNGMLEIVLVCLYSPNVQDPHRLHCPDFVVAISKA
ncbi:hypothetical protein AVEN_111636-1 [Araneus ventricosus]|uniref:RNase H type-1 domain-containing protein n=1 Tax=Araneus ventricosus TaxID=182803 RepID=A0A4Y2C446_ARAVE|nr:hypothetical protein AVEN_111636-1 [Araneus ventricosus]